ncbi:sugar porter family MFS transporter TDEL_0E00200 [Torulaspora delbrueckii]|uniref:Major facilitator superfamily (MFS) profile domain-containing protein n=1 Tax=Torulaspora delbrueckii TaxID=4950 RepID=G8ZUG9_TORDE|nr:hypothetical protein TDEL_0E00200 [Torulaspora delbrueckii]CCE92263.1 hypothetical protein TDEL_0E00200 [Torulaspora delbrueckii]
MAENLNASTATPVEPNDLQPVHSDVSRASTPINKVLDELKNGELNPDEALNSVDLPVKPFSAYLTTCLLCLCVAFGGFMFGWDTGTISGFINQTDFLRRFGSRHTDGTYYLSKVRTGLVVSIFNVGCAMGGIILSKLGDIYGRKIGLMTVVVIYIVGILIQICSFDKWYQYFIGRIISGLGVGGIAVLSPMLISESSPKHLRGPLVSSYQLMITAGIFLGYCTNYGTRNYSDSTQWRVPLGLCFAWSLFMLAGLTRVPESPRYLVGAGKIEEAKRSVAKSNKVSIDDPALLLEIEMISAGVEAEKVAGSASIGELFSTKTKVFNRLVMGILLQALQQLTGNNYFFYYGTSIFKSVGLEDSFQTSIIIGVINFASTFGALYTVEKFGRRTCLLWGSATMMACMVIYASVGVTRLYPNGMDQPTSKGAGNCMICFTMFYIFCYALSWAPIAWVVTAEVFPLRVKSKCMALASASNWLWGFLISFFTPFITGAINFYYGYVFVGCLCFSYFYVFFFVPESKGLTLEEIDEMWVEGVLPWRSTEWVPAARRNDQYNPEDLKHDDKPWYKRMA